jgi:Zn-dependent peptidase ImmA (M78 family)/transcriptional regulator with XRE-family HTH domain
MKLTLADVEQRSAIGASTLSEFENGKREPRLTQLKELADLYRRSTTFFLDQGPLPQEVVLWRKKPTSPKAETVQADFLRLAEQYQNLERWCDNIEEARLPFASGTQAQFRYAHAEKLAHDFRVKHGLGERPGQSLLRVLEEICKVKVFHMPFEPTGSAACTYSDLYGTAVLLNSNSVRWRRNFDLAHELFHLLTWNIFRQGESSFVESSAQEEKLATCFARNLLMPQEPLRIAIDAYDCDPAKLSFDDLFDVARQFDVSVESLLWHMSFIYKLPKEIIQNKVEQLQGRMAFWEKRQHDTPPSRPLRFEALANEALRKGSLSTGKYAEYLGITRRQAMRLAEQEAPDDAEIQVTHS